jgi:hypothetical protein
MLWSGLATGSLPDASAARVSLKRQTNFHAGRLVTAPTFQCYGKQRVKAAQRTAEKLMPGHFISHPPEAAHFFARGPVMLPHLLLGDGFWS